MSMFHFQLWCLRIRRHNLLLALLGSVKELEGRSDFYWHVIELLDTSDKQLGT